MGTEVLFPHSSSSFRGLYSKPDSIQYLYWAFLDELNVWHNRYAIVLYDHCCGNSIGQYYFGLLIYPKCAGSVAFYADVDSKESAHYRMSIRYHI